MHRFVVTGAALALAGALSGCLMVQGGVGPSRSSTGANGMLGTVGMGLGYSFRGHHALFASVNGGGMLDRHARGLISGHYDYVHFEERWGVQGGLRLGPVFGRERYDLPGRTAVGGAITLYPWAHRLGGRGGYHEHSEKGGLDLDFIPDTVGWFALGLEVAADHQGSLDPSKEPSSWLVTVSVVGALVSMADK